MLQAPAAGEVSVTEKRRPDEAIVPAIPPDYLACEASNLPASQLMAEGGPFTVWIANSQQIPHLLYEIGRLREVTFRAVGEGTGTMIDLSWFDYHYLHLFLWDARRAEVVGAYRIGQTDVILPRWGVCGLYTSTLFTYERELIEYLTPALELSRSFVRREYQRSYSALLLLWKGIGQFIVRHPRYRLLFGAVSISREYRYLSRQLLLPICGRTTFCRRWRALPGPRIRPRSFFFRPGTREGSAPYAVA